MAGIRDDTVPTMERETPSPASAIHRATGKRSAWYARHAPLILLALAMLLLVLAVSTLASAAAAATAPDPDQPPIAAVFTATP